MTKIKINNVNYKIDLEKAKSLGLITPEKPQMRKIKKEDLKVGDLFRLTYGNYCKNSYGECVVIGKTKSGIIKNVLVKKGSFCSDTLGVTYPANPEFLDNCFIEICKNGGWISEIKA